MSLIIDLSQTIENNMPVFPGDIPARLSQTRFLNADHYNDHRLEAGMHTGTHIDGPMHLTESRTYISDLSIESFIGPGCLLDVRGQSIICPQDKYGDLVKENSIVLLYTGHDILYGHPEYFQSYPVIDESMCNFLIKKKIKLLGLDTPSPDKEPYLVHKSFLNNGIYIVENLAQLDRLTGVKEFEVIAMPLKIKADGSMARVAARILK